MVVHPIDNELQECHPCSQETALVRTESRAESVWDFPDLCIEFHCNNNYRIGNPEAIKDHLPASETKVGIFPMSSRIWNAVISVEMVAWSKKSLRRLIKASDKSLILFSGPSPIFFNVRFPENTTFTNANQADEDNVQNCEFLAYDWIKSQQLQTSCSMRVRIRACSDCGLMDFRVSS